MVKILTNKPQKVKGDLLFDSNINLVFAYVLDSHYKQRIRNPFGERSYTWGNSFLLMLLLAYFLCSFNNSSLSSVRFQFYKNFISDKHSNSVQAHLSGQITECFPFYIIELYSKHRIWKRLRYHSQNCCFFFLLVIHYFYRNSIAEERGEGQELPTLHKNKGPQNICDPFRQFLL